MHEENATCARDCSGINCGHGKAQKHQKCSSYLHEETCTYHGPDNASPNNFYTPSQFCEWNSFGECQVYDVDAAATAAAAVAAAAAAAVEIATAGMFTQKDMDDATATAREDGIASVNVCPGPTNRRGVRTVAAGRP